MRRIRLTAVLAGAFLLLAAATTSYANPPCPNCGHGFGGGDFCFRLFPHMFQEGPLFNYGPYYGYYPFTPYGPWDPYLRYNPYFYGDPYANFNSKLSTHPPAEEPDHSGRYGPNLNRHRPGFPLLAIPFPAFPSLPHPGLFHTHGCTTCGFWHASWLHGGWFRGHTWLAGGTHPLVHKPACSTCGGIAVAEPIVPTGDVLTRYTGFGTPGQSAIYYPPTATLDPALELLPATGP